MQSIAIYTKLCNLKINKYFKKLNLINFLNK